MATPRAHTVLKKARDGKKGAPRGQVVGGAAFGVGFGSKNQAPVEAPKPDAASTTAASGTKGGGAAASASADAVAGPGSAAGAAAKGAGGADGAGEASTEMDAEQLAAERGSQVLRQLDMARAAFQFALQDSNGRQLSRVPLSAEACEGLREAAIGFLTLAKGGGADAAAGGALGGALASATASRAAALGGRSRGVKDLHELNLKQLLKQCVKTQVRVCPHSAHRLGGLMYPDKPR